VRDLRLWCAALLFFCVADVKATTYVVPDDATLIGHAEAIVVAVAGESHGEYRGTRSIFTVTPFDVREVIKGRVETAALNVAGMGGALDGRFSIASGVPQFHAGEEVILLLTRNEYGDWIVDDLALGKFTLVTTDSGRFAVRAIGDEISGWLPSGVSYVEPLREADRFLAYVRELAAGQTRRPDYIVMTSDAAFKRRLEPNATPTDYMGTVTVGGVPTGFRWQNNGNETFATN
jgi:hypothetical protein